MKNIFIFIIVIISHFNIVFCQNNFEVELSEGFIFFDYFGNEPEGFENEFAGYGLQTEFDIWRNVYSNKSINFKFGIGYTNYYYLYDYGFSFIAREEVSTSYLNLKIGIDYKPKWSKIIFLVNSTNYFLAHLEKQRRSQNRWFNNLDVGLKIKLFNNFKLSLWTPLTLYPLDKGKYVRRDYRLFKYNFDPWIEITGLNLGISYGFGGKKE